MHKCVEKEVPGMRGDQPFVRWPVADLSYKKNDESGLTPQRDSRPTREGCEQDGPLCHPSNGPDDRSQRLSPQYSQRDLDEQTPVDAVARSQ